MTILATITNEQHEAICKATCPGCAYGLPDTLHIDTGRMVHHMPDTDFEMDCRAAAYRRARARQKNAKEES